MRCPVLRMVGEATHIRASMSSFGQEGGGRKEDPCPTPPVHPYSKFSCRIGKTSQCVETQPRASYPGKGPTLIRCNVEAKNLASGPSWLFSLAWEFLPQPSSQPPRPHRHLSATGVTSARVRLWLDASSAGAQFPQDKPRHEWRPTHLRPGSGGQAGVWWHGEATRVGGSMQEHSGAESCRTRMRQGAFVLQCAGTLSSG